MKISYDVFSKDKTKLITYLRNIRTISESKARKLYEAMQEDEGQISERQYIIKWDETGAMYIQENGRGCLNLDE